MSLGSKLQAGLSVHILDPHCTQVTNVTHCTWSTNIALCGSGSFQGREGAPPVNSSVSTGLLTKDVAMIKSPKHILCLWARGEIKAQISLTPNTFTHSPLTVR